MHSLTFRVRIMLPAIATQPVHRCKSASTQLGGIPYHSPKLHPGDNSVGN